MADMNAPTPPAGARPGGAAPSGGYGGPRPGGPGGGGGRPFGGGGGGGGGGRGRERKGRPRYFPRRKVCPFKAGHLTHIDYKDVDMLKRFISDRGRIEPRRKTGVSAKYQRPLAMALKRARHLALLPYTIGHILETGISYDRPRRN